jgi:hypothetical protein
MSTRPATDFDASAGRHRPRASRSLAPLALLACLASVAPAHGATYDVTRDVQPPARCDGGGDDTAAIRAALALAAADGGGRVYLPAGTCRVSDKLEVASDDIVVFGDGMGSRIQAGRGGTTVFSIAGRDRIELRDLHILEEGVARHEDAGVGSGVSIRGSADEVSIRNVRVTGLAHGIMARELGVGEAISNLTLRDVWVEHTSGWGIEVAGVENARLFDVRVTGAAFDGLKIGKPTRYFEIHGGRFWNNGQNGLGDGIDLHSGGNRWLIVGTRVDGNVAAGINVKSGAGTSAAAPITEGAIIGVVAEGNDVGLNVFSDPRAPALDPTPNHIRVTGGVFARNAGSGIRIGAGRNMTIAGAVVKQNDGHGIHVNERSFDLSMLGLQVSANGREAIHRWSGIDVSGDRVRIIGGAVDGSDDDVAVGNPCAAAGAGCGVWQHAGIAFAEAAEDGLVAGTGVAGAFTGGPVMGTTPLVEDVASFATRASGVVRIPADQTSVTVAHRVARVPSLAQLSVTPVSVWGAATSYWISDPTASSFRLNVDVEPGLSLDFRWPADVSGH